MRLPVIDGVKICEQAYYVASGVSRQTYFKYKKQALAENKVVTRTRQSNRCEHTVTALHLFEVRNYDFAVMISIKHINEREQSDIITMTFHGMQEIVRRDGQQQPYRQMQNKEDGTWRTRINLPLNYTKLSVTESINEQLDDLVSHSFERQKL